MATHINIFRAGEYSTFAIARETFNKLLYAPKIKPSTVVLYLYLLREAKHPLLRLHTPTITEQTGLDRKTVRRAVQDLIDLKLLLIDPNEESAKGFVLYELLNETGGKIPLSENWVEFKELTDQQVEAFYADRLGVLKAPGYKEGRDVLLFKCPFCAHSPNKHPFQVTLNKGGDYHGHFLCGSKNCGKKGGMIHFQVLLEGKRGNMMSGPQAGRLVRAFLTSQIKGEDAPHPALLEMTKPDPKGAGAI